MDAAQRWRQSVQKGQRYRFVDAPFNTAPANVYDSQFYDSPLLQTTGGCGAGSFMYTNPYVYQGVSYTAPYCGYNFAADIDLVLAQNQKSLMASYTQRVGPDGKLQFDMLLSRSEVTSHLAPAPATMYLAKSSPYTMRPI